MLKRFTVKLSSLDVRAPPNVEIVFNIGVFGNFRNIPQTICKLHSIEEAQAKSDELTRKQIRHVVTTSWRHKVSKNTVSKWNTLRMGTRRTFRVSVPWTEGIPDEKIIEAIKELLVLYNDSYQGKISVRAFTEKELNLK